MTKTMQNQALHRDRGRILVSRDTTPLQRPWRVNCVVLASCNRPRGLPPGRLKWTYEHISMAVASAHRGRNDATQPVRRHP